MKYFAITIVLVVWLLATVLLSITIVGIIVFMIEDDNNEIYWFNFALNLRDDLCE